jgi:hypothetical protein
MLFVRIPAGAAHPGFVEGNARSLIGDHAVPAKPDPLRPFRQLPIKRFPKQHQDAASSPGHKIPQDLQPDLAAFLRMELTPRHATVLDHRAIPRPPVGDLRD